MSKYLKLFSNHSGYTGYKRSDSFVRPNVSYCIEQNDVHYNPSDYSNEYLTFVSPSATTMTWYYYSRDDLTYKTIYYSKDDGDTWTEVTQENNTVSMGANERVMVKGNNTHYAKGTYIKGGNGGISVGGYHQFIFGLDDEIRVYGNVMSLIYGDDFIGKKKLEEPYTFGYMFSMSSIADVEDLCLPADELTEGCYALMFYSSKITKAPKLPATALATGCYSNMFRDCTALTTASELPATKMEKYCYQGMFANCASLTNAPELPSTELELACYNGMFYECASLESAPSFPATVLKPLCYNGTFGETDVLPDCSNIDFTSESVVNSGGLYGLFRGTKVTDEDLFNILPTDTNDKYCLPVMNLRTFDVDEIWKEVGPYQWMFSSCQDLTTAPELPATNLCKSCYDAMFFASYSLANAPSTLPATSLAEYCYAEMFYSCSGLTNVPQALPATTLATGCYSDMFRECAALTTAPELPATTLVNGCYSYMFNGCSNLNYIKAMFTTTPSTSWRGGTYKWVDGVAASGTFVKNSAATWTTTGVNGVPNGWTVETASA